MYEKILSEIHDKWFSRIAESAAEQIRRSSRDLIPFRIADLGCGSGVFLERLKKDCSEMHGFDISEEMIRRCRRRLPEGSFSTGNILNIQISKVNVISMIGEILSYALAEEGTFEKIRELFQRIYESLENNGVLIFDVLGNRHDYSGNFIHEHSEFSIFSRVTVEKDIVKREIISFRKMKRNYCKSIEIHRLRMLDENFILELLKSCGFSAVRLEKYADEPVLPGRIAFECRKIS